MNPAELLDKYKNKIVDGLIIIVALIIAFNLFMGQLSKEQSLKLMIEDEGKKNVLLNNIKDAENKFSAYKDFFGNKEANSVINDISNIAKEAGVRVASIRPGQQEPYKHYVKYVFDVSITAPNYDSFAKFVNKVESYQDIYFVDNAVVNSASEEIAEGQAKSPGTGRGLMATLNISYIAKLK